MDFKAVVFDLDGTLIDSVEDLANAVNESLESFDFPSHDIEKFNYFIGSGAQVMVTKALPQEHRDEETVRLCLEKFNEIYDKNYNVKTSLYNGIPELLDYLSESDFKISILTNKPYQFTMKYVDELLSDWNFNIVIGQLDGLPKKPDPTGALRIAKELSLKPSEIIYLGDSGVDMVTAVKAGMYPVGVLWGLRDSEELLQNGAERLINSPLELLSILNI